MEIRCGRCRRSYFVPDDVVQGRALRARCSLCGHAFSVDVAGRGRRRGRSRPYDLPDPSASAIPDLLEGLEGQLGWLEEAAREADEQETVLLTVQRARRSSAALMVGAAVLLLAAAAGAGAWVALRPAPRVAARSEPPLAAPAPAVEDVAGLAPRLADPGPEAIASAADAQAPAPATPRAARPPVERARAQRLARHERHLLDLLARKADVAVAPVDEEEEGAGAARSALDPAVAARVVAAHRSGFDACVSRALRQRPGLALPHRATLVVTVQPGGAVQRAYLAEEAVDRSDVGACIAESARRMVFPAFDGEPVDVATPLSLTAAF